MIQPCPIPQLLRRLSHKSLEHQFQQIVTEGLNCSPFEAQAVLDVVKEVFYPYMDEADPRLPPGRITLMVVCADEPSGKPIASCAKRLVTLIIHRGEQDDEIMVRGGAAAFRQARIPDLAQEALSQGGILTNEDLAYRVFFVSPRTITNDLKQLRSLDPPPPLPLRGTKHDIGPYLTHRVEIVELALDGHTMSEIVMKTRHSPKAIANYLSTFARCAYLREIGMEDGQIAFLLHKGRRLIEQYVNLMESCKGDANRSYHLNELRRLESAGKKMAEPEALR